MQTVVPKKRRFNPLNSRFLILLMIILLVYFAVSLGFQLHKLWAMQESIVEMEAQVMELRQHNARLWERLAALESESYIEETARDRLGLIRPGETRIVPVLPEQDGYAPIERNIQD